MCKVISRTERRNRRAPTPIDPNWQPVGLIVKRLMLRHNLPRPTAIVVVEAAGHGIEAQP